MRLLFAFLFTCTLFATALAQQPVIMPLWPNGTPGFENLKDTPEQAQDYWVRHINNPSIAVYMPPKDKATRAAVVICPGGGHRLLVYNAEGVEPIVSSAVAAFFGEGSH